MEPANCHDELPPGLEEPQRRRGPRLKLRIETKTETERRRDEKEDEQERMRVDVRRRF